MGKRRNPADTRENAAKRPPKNGRVAAAKESKSQRPGAREPSGSQAGSLGFTGFIFSCFLLSSLLHSFPLALSLFIFSLSRSLSFSLSLSLPLPPSPPPRAIESLVRCARLVRLAVSTCLRCSLACFVNSWFDCVACFLGFFATLAKIQIFCIAVLAGSQNRSVWSMASGRNGGGSHTPSIDVLTHGKSTLKPEMLSMDQHESLKEAGFTIGYPSWLLKQRLCKK